MHFALKEKEKDKKESLACLVGVVSYSKIPNDLRIHFYHSRERACRNRIIITSMACNGN